MEIDFTNIEYLKVGNERQQLAYFVLKKLGIFESFKRYNPILTGTIPININLPESDLDIICQCENHHNFKEIVIDLYNKYESFKIENSFKNDIEITVVNFKINSFEIEIFAQNIPTLKQNAYRHMVIEHKILIEKGAEFRKKIIALKAKGVKTEPAFAKLLNLKGNPYKALLNLE